MTYDEFSNKLREVKDEFERVKGLELTTIEQLEKYLAERKTKRLSKGLKSLKGLDV